jgi:hypothetical protein
MAGKLPSQSVHNVLVYRVFPSGITLNDKGGVVRRICHVVIFGQERTDIRSLLARRFEPARFMSSRPSRCLRGFAAKAGLRWRQQHVALAAPLVWPRHGRPATLSSPPKRGSRNPRSHQRLPRDAGGTRRLCLTRPGVVCATFRAEGGRRKRVEFSTETVCGTAKDHPRIQRQDTTQHLG